MAYLEICATLLVCFFTLVIGYYERVNAERRQRTMAFILEVVSGLGGLHETQLTFSQWKREGRNIKDDQVSDEDDKVIISLLDFYDLIADSASKRILDKEMIITHLGGRMRSAFEILQLYINSRRTRLKRPGLYQPFESFVRKHVFTKEV
ncbi:MAG: DUF4760 domain-containing protein [Luteolibacter sp.]